MLAKAMPLTLFSASPFITCINTSPAGLTTVATLITGVTKLAHLLNQLNMTKTQMIGYIREGRILDLYSYLATWSDASCESFGESGGQNTTLSLESLYQPVLCAPGERSDDHTGLQSHQSSVVGNIHLTNCWDIEPHKSREHAPPEVEEFKCWDSLPHDILGYVLRKLGYEDLFQVKLVSRGIKKLIESPAFRTSRGQSLSQEGLLTTLYLYIMNGALQCSGFDLLSNKWRPLPIWGCLPFPDLGLFKEYLVCAGGGLLCANVSKSLDRENLVVCNLMTQISKVLPPLNFPRNPVLLHILVNPHTDSYKVIVAGSSGMSGGHILSRKTEVFDSLTSTWEVTGDLPGLEFSLNEYQTGVCINGILYCIAFLEDGSGKGVLAYNVEEGRWLVDWKCSLPGQGNANTFAITQLVECDGELYLFSERDAGRIVEHHIEKLESADDINSGGPGLTWKNVVTERIPSGRGLLVYPEFACVGFGVGKLCVFNTIDHTGNVYDISNGGHMGSLPSNPSHKGSEGFHSLNPLTFTFEPNFASRV